MSKQSLWCVLLTVPLLFWGTERANAVEYGELVQKNPYACESTAPGISEKRSPEIPCGTWTFKSTEDPVFKYMRDTGWITNERYFAVSEQTGKNWIEPADAVLNRGCLVLRSANATLVKGKGTMRGNTYKRLAINEGRYASMCVTY